MKVYHGSCLIFYISDTKVKVKEIHVQIWITAVFIFPCFVAIKIAVWVILWVILLVILFSVNSKST